MEDVAELPERQVNNTLAFFKKLIETEIYYEQQNITFVSI